jgi:hypothetical protein
MMRCFFAIALALPLLAPTAGLGKETIKRAENLSADVASDGRVVIDLLGDIWLVPGEGGKASRLTSGLRTATRPRWSPDDSNIVFQAMAGGASRLHIFDLKSGSWQRVSRDSGSDLHPSWHPHGGRIVYASDRSGSGFDLWEVHLSTGLHWRLSSGDGDELEPAWSDDGRDLVYVHHAAGQWSLVLRRHGEPEETLLATADRIAAPAWRPDGSLITFHRTSASGTRIDMVILSEPRLIRNYASGENFVAAPISWRDRQRMIYTADGTLRQRSFDDWSSDALPFEAEIRDKIAAPVVIPRRQLPRIDEPAGRLVVHAGRLFDGVLGDYRKDVDIVIERGYITAIEEHAERPSDIVINLGDLTVLPGLIDAAAALPPEFDERFGALILASGVTTLVAGAAGAEQFNATWSGKQMPGPRLLQAEKWPVKTAPSLVDAATPGLAVVLESRQATAFGLLAAPPRRFLQLPARDVDATSLVLGSRDSGLPAGLALQGELIARAAAGLQPAQILRAAGVNAAAALGVDPYLGRVAVGAVADLLFVDGDPLADVSDAIRIVAVVRNGRFFSIAGLLERAAGPQPVD